MTRLKSPYEDASSRVRLVRSAGFAVAVAVLVMAYAGVCMQAGTPWPWNRVVHEDGRHTLLTTVFFFEHAARELVLDLVLAVGLAAATRTYFGVKPSNANRANWPAVASLAIVVTILLGTVVTVGSAELASALKQMHTRPGAPLAVGAHWNFHLLERFSLVVGVFALAAVIARATGCLPGHRASPAPLLAVAGAYLGISLLFGIPCEPFCDPVYLGHQARELATHGLVTVPLGMAACLTQVRCGREPDPGVRHGSAAAWGAAVVAILAATYVVGAALYLDARSQGQQSDLGALLFPHVFEHAFTYVFVPVTAMALLRSVHRRPGRRS